MKWHILSYPLRIKVPLTKVVLTASRKDIICTKGLSVQLVVLTLTAVFGLLTIKYSSQVVPVDTLFYNILYANIALALTTLVDPLVSMVFSASYRREAWKIIRLE